MTLSFNPEKHEYQWQGKKVPSVTQVLSLLADHWNHDPYYMDRGRIIHTAAALDDRDELEESSVDSAILSYLKAYRSFRLETGFKPAVIEEKYFHSKFIYAGTVDRIGLLNGKRALIDVKSGQPFPTDPIQLIAYAELIEVNTNHVDKMFNLYLHDDGCYRLVERPKKRTDFNLFLCCLQIWNFKEETNND